MKLQHLAIGDRFEYEGKIFVKTGPITAASEDGGQRVIPRSAVLKATLAHHKENLSGTEHFSSANILAAFEVFYQDCCRLSPETSHSELAMARDHFLSTLKYSGSQLRTNSM